MKMKKLGSSDLLVSKLCLGSMTWGQQNTPEEAFGQIDMALDGGINFIDTAELYPTYPVLPQTQGKTEEIIGEWFARTKRRGDVVLASKVAGEGVKHIRAGAPISAQTIREAIEGSLRRLKTDVIDLYQLHWPNRGSYHFRQYWEYEGPSQDRAEVEDSMLDVLQEMERQVQAGRVRWFGLSNESTWGTTKWLDLADAHGLPRMQSLQNEYSLLCRINDFDLTELSAMEKVDLLAYTPLAAGLLTGKYTPDLIPPGSRRAVSADLSGRITGQVWGAIDEYRAVAQKHGLDLVHMALAWAMARPFMGSVIFGATKPEHVKRALGAADLDLAPEVMQDIDAVHRQYPMPF